MEQMNSKVKAIGKISILYVWLHYGLVSQRNQIWDCVLPTGPLHSETESSFGNDEWRTSKANGCERGFSIDDGIELLPTIVPRELTPSVEEEPATWSPARVRPSVALQMKTLNNLVAGCKSRREATEFKKLIYSGYPARVMTDRQPGGVGVETRGAAADNILAGSSFMIRGYEPGRTITPRIFSVLVVPLRRSLHLRESSATGCQFLRAYRTINWKRDCYRSTLLTLNNHSFLDRVCNSSHNVITRLILQTKVDKLQQNIALYYPGRNASCSIMVKGGRERGQIARVELQIHTYKAHNSSISRAVLKIPASGAYRIKGDGKSVVDMGSHGGSTVQPPIIHWLKPSTEQLMRPAYRRVRGDHSRWTGIIIRQRLPIGETSVGVAR
ncbi:hypothetical protein G5I_02550 [Acromyrmex echinatior]|uniref:Uncharacterized protein n=1 Tax=Acromyrmex echinatior TaxID=103372 RepID=F4WAL2_ACREC|nr:hypothetical protein G5I_02550 [Acromyrmex echinatior]